jgi:DNA-3-methyladenine glycosylase
VVRIVEAEAYIGTDDLASHARFGPTSRNLVMFGPAGRAYVYLVYGMYHCLNVVTEPDGRAAAVLIRAAEPIAGADAMRAARLDHRGARRRSPRPPAAAIPTGRLARGPGVLCAALSIDRTATGLDLLDPRSPLRLELPDEPVPDDRIATSPRIGIDYAPEPWRSAPWRLFDRASAAVSG